MPTTPPTLPPGPVAGAASAHCQRWVEGRHLFRHPTDARFDPDRFTVVELPEATARAFVTRHHYAGTYPAARVAYGLLTDDEALVVDGTEVHGLGLVGVAVLSVPMRASVLTNVFPELDPYTQSLELGRLVLTDTPANAESWFCARVFAAAAQTGIRGVVSFADPMARTRVVVDVDETGATVERREQVTPGHVGIVYQALGGVPAGRSTPRSLVYLPRHGIVVADRTLSKVRGQESGADGAERKLVTLGARARVAGQDPTDWLRRALGDLGAVRVRHPGNFRYAWPVGTPAQRRRVRLVVPPGAGGYPKPDTDRFLIGPAARR